MTELENIPEDEAGNIAKIAALTVQQLDQRYPAPQPIRRGVHAKDHSCVKATFKVNANLPDELRTGAFACAGHEYEAAIRSRRRSARCGRWGSWAAFGAVLSPPPRRRTRVRRRARWTLSNSAPRPIFSARIAR